MGEGAVGPGPALSSSHQHVENDGALCVARTQARGQRTRLDFLLWRVVTT